MTTTGRWKKIQKWRREIVPNKSITDTFENAMEKDDEITAI